MSISVSQLSFTGGEFAPSLFARVDLEKYASGLRTMRNAICHPHGGVSNRGGTEFVGFVKNVGQRTRLVPFQFSVSDTYMLEFGQQYIRFYRDGGRIVEGSKGINSATKTNPVRITINNHGYANGDWVVISGVRAMTELNGRTFKVAGSTSNSFDLNDINGNNIDGTGYRTGAGGTSEKVYEIPTPYTHDKLSRLRFCQSADTLYITHPDYAPRTLSRSGHTSWSLANIGFGAGIAPPGGFRRASGAEGDRTFAVTAVSASGEESTTSNSATGDNGAVFRWNRVVGAHSYNIYEQISGLYRYYGTAGAEQFTIKSSVEADMADTAPQVRDPFTGANNYPAVSCFHEQRWVAAATKNRPQDIWGSVTGSFSNMNVSIPGSADDAYNFTLNSQQVNEIRWLVPMSTLLIGTSAGEFRMTAGTTADAITANSVDIKKQSSWGSSYVQPLTIGNSVLFIERSLNIIRDLTYSFEIDGYASNHLSILSNHLFDGHKIIEWCYSQYPDSVIWCVRSDGALLGMTYYREHQVWGWHRHDTQGRFKSIASLPEGEVYVIVERTLNGVKRGCVELFRHRLPPDDDGNYDVRDAYIVDCGLSYDSPLTITGATATNPVVITSPGHGFENGDQVLILRVRGMTELNGNNYIVARQDNNKFSLKMPVTGGASITGATATHPVVITSTGHGFENGDQVQITGVLGMTELNGKTHTVVSKTDDTFNLAGVNGSGYGEYTAGGYAEPLPVNVDGRKYSAYTSGGQVRKEVTKLSGLDHLEGETVSVLADGNVISGTVQADGTAPPNPTVSDGAITLTQPAAIVHVGLGYTTEIETMDFDYQTKTGTVQDKIRHIHSAVLTVENTRGFFVGADPNRLDELIIEGRSETFSLYSGDAEIFLESGAAREGRVFARNTTPTPFTILSITARMTHGDS